MLTAWRNLPLRVKLTVLYVGLLTVLLVILGLSLYYDTRSFMISTTVQSLRSQNQPVIERLYRSGPPRQGQNPAPGLGEIGSASGPPTLADIAPFLAQSQTSPNMTAAVYSTSGKLLADGHSQPEQPLSAPVDPVRMQRALAGDPNQYYTTSFSGQDTLVILIPLRSGPPGSVQTGVMELSARMDVIDEVLARQRLLIILGVFVMLGLGTLGGLWITTSALSPLQRMIATTRRIAGGDLSQRVNLPRRRDEIGQLTASFDEMVERLEETFAAQRQFIGDASHELRTPLTAIAGSLDVILLAPEGDPEMTRRMLSGMRRELQRLTRLVTDLLTLNRLDAHQSLHLQTVDLATLASEVAEQMKPVAGERRVEVEREGDTRVQGDADRLKQVLLNLIDNAIRFTEPEKGVIRLRVYQSGKDVHLAVSDNGSGIPPEAQAHIFERFYRVDKARARASGGSGLGLAIVKAIVEAHHGAIAPIKSEPGQGSTFEISIPQTADGRRPTSDH